VIYMAMKKVKLDPKAQAEFVARVRREQADREHTYREKALRLFPHICGRCAREFSGAGLRELTVHHRDHNHNNNPPDGSNWELLCECCHEDEHLQERKGGYNAGFASAEDDEPSLGHNPFEGLKDLLKPGSGD
jgi:HNH endonuclease